MHLREFQKHIEAIYFDRDKARGQDGTFYWFVEEVGELAHALRTHDRANLEEEFADVAAWLATLASLADIDLEKAVDKYGRGCPRCGHTPCNCPVKA